MKKLFIFCLLLLLGGCDCNYNRAQLKAEYLPSAKVGVEYSAFIQVPSRTDVAGVIRQQNMGIDCVNCWEPKVEGWEYQRIKQDANNRIILKGIPTKTGKVYFDLEFAEYSGIYICPEYYKKSYIINITD